MAFQLKDLTPVAQSGTDSPDLWGYTTTDALATVVASGYFDNANRQLTKGDAIFVHTSTGGSAESHLLSVATISSQVVTTSSGVNIGSPGGGVHGNFTFTGDVISSTGAIELTPTSGGVVINDNSTSTTPLLKLNQVGSGDASIEFVAGTSWIMGPDNSDSDNWKLAVGNDLSSGAIMVMEPGGNTGFGLTNPARTMDIGVSIHADGIGLNQSTADAGTYITYLDSDGSQVNLSSFSSAFSDGTFANTFTMFIRDTKDFQIFTSVDGSAGSKKFELLNNGRLGLGLASAPTAQLDVDQSDGTAAIPVMKLDQGDASEPFIDYIGTSAADANNSISTLTTSGSTTHHIQIDINGVKAWIAVSTTNPT